MAMAGVDRLISVTLGRARIGTSCIQIARGIAAGYPSTESYRWASQLVVMVVYGVHITALDGI